MVITTDKFIGLARMAAAALGVPDLDFELIPHPLGGIAPELAFDRGRELAAAIVSYLGGAGD